MAEHLHAPLAIIRRKTVEARTGLSRSSIYAKIAAGEFPAPVALGVRAVGWVESEVAGWLARRIEASRKAAK
jgi:prophage regulatory protein